MDHTQSQWRVFGETNLLGLLMTCRDEVTPGRSHSMKVQMDEYRRACSGCEAFPGRLGAAASECSEAAERYDRSVALAHADIVDAIFRLHSLDARWPPGSLCIRS